MIGAEAISSISAELTIASSGGAMSVREAAELFTSQNNPEHVEQLLTDGFFAGVAAGECLNDFDDSPEILHQLAIASDVLRIYHEKLSLQRWRDIVDEQPQPGDLVEARLTANSSAIGPANVVDGQWHIHRVGRGGIAIDLWRPVRDVL
jgi:hypothetical protein